MHGPVQELNLKLMAFASFNELDGARVADDLRKHSDLWDAAVMGDISGERLQALAELPYPEEFWNVDTLYLLAHAGKERELEELAHSWSADVVRWMTDADAGRALGEVPTPRKVLCISWD